MGLIDLKLAAQKIEVHNASAGSFSPIIYFRKIKHLIETVGLEFDEVIVFLDISDIQNEVEFYLDKDLNVKLRGYFPEEAERTLPERERFTDWDERWSSRSIVMRAFVALKMRLGKEQADLDDSVTQHYALASWTIDQDVFNSYAAGGLSGARKNMPRLLELLRAHDIPLTLAVYPWPIQIARRDLFSIQVQFWPKWCRENQVSFLNFFPALINDSLTSDEAIQSYFIQGDVHWNEPGHALVASQFLAQRKPALRSRP